MRSYVLVSSIVFDAIFALQVARLWLQWPVSVANVNVPLWPSAIAAVVAASISAWGLRVFLKTRGLPPSAAT